MRYFYWSSESPWPLKITEQLGSKMTWSTLSTGNQSLFFSVELQGKVSTSQVFVYPIILINNRFVTGNSPLCLSLQEVTYVHVSRDEKLSTSYGHDRSPITFAEHNREIKWFFNVVSGLTNLVMKPRAVRYWPYWPLRKTVWLIGHTNNFLEKFLFKTKVQSVFWFFFGSTIPFMKWVTFTGW